MPAQNLIIFTAQCYKHVSICNRKTKKQPKKSTEVWYPALIIQTVLGVSKSSHTAAKACTVNQVPAVHFCHSGHSSATVTVYGKEQLGWCRGEVFPRERDLVGWRGVGERFSDTQVLLNISLTARSLDSWEWIIHPLNPACVPLSHQAPASLICNVWCCWNFPVAK